MSLTVERSDRFRSDFARQFAWYVQEAGEAVAWRFHEALDLTLQTIATTPDIGVRRNFRHPQLNGLRSFRVAAPFGKLLIFYRVRADVIEAWRLMHGARDLEKRLVQEA